MCHRSHTSRSKWHLIWWLQSPLLVTLETRKLSLSLFPQVYPFYLLSNDVTRCPDLCGFSYFLYSFIFISWRLIISQHCSGFCHTLTWISQGYTCIPHPDPPYHLPLHPIPLGLPSAPVMSTCLMNPTCAGDLFHSW